jgi:hypothetical protein
MIKEAQQLSGRGFLSGVGLPTGDTGNVIVYVDVGRSGDFSHRDIHHFGKSSGLWLGTWHYGRNQSAADWILWAMHPLHFGTL